MRKPRNINLNRFNEIYEFQANSQKGRKLFYLKPDKDTFIWIEGKRKLKAIQKWLKDVEKWMDAK